MAKVELNEIDIYSSAKNIGKMDDVPNSNILPLFGGIK
jgi:hypothetical protein